MKKYFSRKFIVTLMVGASTVSLPVLYKQIGVSDSITMAVLAILAAVATGYGIISNKAAKILKDAEIEKDEK